MQTKCNQKIISDNNDSSDDLQLIKVPTFLDDISDSIFKGHEKHCGKCGTCTERIEAFHDAGVEDPTEYEELASV